VSLLNSARQCSNADSVGHWRWLAS
jgi:hypothetical protein